MSPKCSKSRTSLAERTIGKTFIAYVEHKIAAKLPEEHPLHAWTMIHAPWILNRFHVSNVTGMTSHTALRGRPYIGACERQPRLRPLHVKKQLDKISMANQKQTKNTKTTTQKAKRRSPSQICVSPSSREAKQKAKGAGPNKNNHKQRFAMDSRNSK